MSDVELEAAGAPLRLLLLRHEEFDDLLPEPAVAAKGKGGTSLLLRHERALWDIDGLASQRNVLHKIQLGEIDNIQPSTHREESLEMEARIGVEDLISISFGDLIGNAGSECTLTDS